MREGIYVVKIRVIIIFAILLMQSSWASDGIIFSHSRIIFPAMSRVITLTVQNGSEIPYLVQTGISGEPQIHTPAPFLVTPPLFRLNRDSQTVMRIVRTDGDLPTDRESVFYFYANAIPGESTPVITMENNENVKLSISLRSVLKMFWRPQGLKIVSEAAPERLVFLARNGGVMVENPTPYYQTFAILSFDGQLQDLQQQPSMVSPFSTIFFPSLRPVHRVTWAVMDDYGGITDKQNSPVK